MKLSLANVLYLKSDGQNGDLEFLTQRMTGLRTEGGLVKLWPSKFAQTMYFLVLNSTKMCDDKYAINYALVTERQRYVAR